MSINDAISIYNIHTLWLDGTTLCVLKVRQIIMKIFIKILIEL